MPARGMPLGFLPVFLICAAALWLAAACGGAPEPCRGAPNQQISILEEGRMTTPHATPTDERIHEVRLKYDPLFGRQPYYGGVGEGLFRDENGEWTGTVGIIVHVAKKVDQNTLPPEDRIPDCLEGVPVQILEEPGLELMPLPNKEEDNG